MKRHFRLSCLLFSGLALTQAQISNAIIPIESLQIATLECRTKFLEPIIYNLLDGNNAKQMEVEIAHKPVEKRVSSIFKPNEKGISESLTLSVSDQRGRCSFELHPLVLIIK